MFTNYKLKTTSLKQLMTWGLSTCMKKSSQKNVAIYLPCLLEFMYKNSNFNNSLNHQPQDLNCILWYQLKNLILFKYLIKTVWLIRYHLFNKYKVISKSLSIFLFVYYIFTKYNWSYCRTVSGCPTLNWQKSTDRQIFIYKTLIK